MYTGDPLDPERFTLPDDANDDFDHVAFPRITVGTCWLPLMICCCIVAGLVAGIVALIMWALSD